MDETSKQNINWKKCIIACLCWGHLADNWFWTWMVTPGCRPLSNSKNKVYRALSGVCGILSRQEHPFPNNTNTSLMAFTPSLALDPTIEIHSHKTLDTAQPCHLLKPNWKPSSSHSISILTNICTQFLLQSVCVCVVRFCCYFCIILYVHCLGRTMFYMWRVKNIIFRLICIMWVLRALMSAR